MRASSMWAIGSMLLAIVTGCQPTAVPSIPQDSDSTLWNMMLVAEDARIGSVEALEPLRDGLRSGDSVIRAFAVRALGRLEQPSHGQLILQLMTDSTPLVRMEAANALGQAVYRGGAATVTAELLNSFSRETDPSTRGVIGQTLGRLPYESIETVAAVETALVDAAADAESDELVGIARGVESLVRRQAGRVAFSQRLIETLHTLAGHRSGASDADAARVRRLGVTSLTRIGRADLIAASAADDRDVEVRRLAVTGVAAMDELANRAQIIDLYLGDESPEVRYAALRAYGRRVQPAAGCAPILDAMEDPDIHVALLAIDLLGSGCENDQEAASLLFDIAGRLVEADTWHRPAHALVSLAKIDSAGAGQLLSQFAEYESWWVRMYAARAAVEVGALSLLKRLAFDGNDNVRQAAISGLSQLVGHEADSIYVAQLERLDYQLVMTAARVLGGSPRGDAAVPQLLASMERITSEGRETSRDARVAIIQRMGELGGGGQSVDVRPYLTDFDLVIASEAARILTQWTGEKEVASPVALAAQPLPSFGELKELAIARPVIEMSEGGSIELRLLPFEAPTNAARFARLARAGYFDGLTFHRVVPGFVIQGGSPGANEYVGDGPYTRDELTLRSHVRGTVGVSTRGRDTGDGQIFINLVDNFRLDHNYTIFAEVVQGMDIVDALLEGATIERIVWR